MCSTSSGLPPCQEAPLTFLRSSQSISRTGKPIHQFFADAQWTHAQSQRLAVTFPQFLGPDVAAGDACASTAAAGDQITRQMHQISSVDVISVYSQTLNLCQASPSDLAASIPTGETCLPRSKWSIRLCNYQTVAIM